MTFPRSLPIALLLSLAMLSSVQAEEVDVQIDGATATASQGSDQAEGELTPAEQHVLKVADESQRSQIEQLVGHRLLGRPVRASGTLERRQYDVIVLQGEVLSYAFKGVSTFGPERDAFEDMKGLPITLRGLATLSEDDVPPLGTKMGDVYRAEPIYTQWPEQRQAELDISGLLGSEETRSGRVEGNDLVTASGSIMIVGSTARWLRDNHGGERATVRGFVLNIQPQPVFVVSHVQAGAKKMGVKVKSASPLGGFGSRLFSKKARWFTRQTYGQSSAVVAPGGSLFLGGEGFVKATDVKLIAEPADSNPSGLIQGMGGK